MSFHRSHLALLDVPSGRSASEATDIGARKNHPLALPAATLALAAIISRSEMNTMAGSRRHED